MQMGYARVAERAARNELLGLYKNHRAATAEANFQGMILKRIVKENHGQACRVFCSGLSRGVSMNG
jgi:hypothetical protein